MAIQIIPGLGVALAAALGIKWPKLGGAILVAYGLNLALLWALRFGGRLGWPAYAIMPGGLVASGLMLLLGKRP